jgi:hypothetical protein
MAVPERKYEPLSVEGEVRALLARGRIFEAGKLVENAGDLLPEGSSLRKIFAPPRFKDVDRRDVDRTPEFNWLKANGSVYSGKWVALVGENLVACAETLDELLAEIEGRSFVHNPLVHHIID